MKSFSSAWVLVLIAAVLLVSGCTQDGGLSGGCRQVGDECCAGTACSDMSGYCPAGETPKLIGCNLTSCDPLFVCEKNEPDYVCREAAGQCCLGDVCVGMGGKCAANETASFLGCSDACAPIVGCAYNETLGGANDTGDSSAVLGGGGGGGGSSSTDDTDPTPDPSPTCWDGPQYCDDADECWSHGWYWWNGTCNADEEPSCSNNITLCADQQNCTTNGYYWWANQTCHYALQFPIPNCTGQELNATPVHLDNLTSIWTRGYMAPPGHTLPTDHTYLFLTNEIRAAEGNATLYAPGDVIITSISWNNDSDIAGEPWEGSIRFALCGNVTGFYNHVKNLSAELWGVYQNYSVCAEDEWGEGGSNTTCTRDMNWFVNSGTEIGEVGYKQGIFDLGLQDDRVNNYFINISRYGGEHHYVCPYDYFNETAKTQLYDLFLKNETEPKCGNTSQDILGSLQGVWFHDNETRVGGEDAREYALAFAYDHWEPPETIISIGTSANSPFNLWVVDLNDSATDVNVTFSNATEINKTYCYEGRDHVRFSTTKWDGRILVKMLTNMSLELEWQNQSCTGDFNLTVNSTLYKR